MPTLALLYPSRTFCEAKTGRDQFELGAGLNECVKHRIFFLDGRRARNLREHRRSCHSDPGQQSASNEHDLHTKLLN